MAATHLGGYGCSLWPDRDRPAGVFALLEVVMENLPRLDGALCYQRPEMFDAGADPAPALELCRVCPCLGACRRRVDRLSRREKESLTGVQAGIDHGGKVDVVRRRR